MPVLAIDQGTTATKAVLVEADGAWRLLGSRRHRQILPRELGKRTRKQTLVQRTAPTQVKAAPGGGALRPH